ncbi:MAG: tetratricopeptide repeat protein [Flavobacteriales bacterium]|nr:tetratricopeptide repeat protein [Flavobacteriales bacterium]
MKQLLLCVPLAFIISRTQAQAMIHYTNGIELYEETNYFEAVDEFTKAITIDPSYSEAYMRRGDSKRKLSDYDGAIVDYQRVADSDKELHYEALANIAFCLELSREPEKAYSIYAQLIRDYPNNVEVRLNRAMLRQGFEDYAGALEDYSEAIELEPTNSEAHTSSGYVLFLLERFEEAIMACTNALTLNPQEGVALRVRALAYKKVGKIDAACSDWRTLLEIDPTETTFSQIAKHCN